MRTRSRAAHLAEVGVDAIDVGGLVEVWSFCPHSARAAKPVARRQGDVRLGRA